MVPIFERTQVGDALAPKGLVQFCERGKDPLNRGSVEDFVSTHERVGDVTHEDTGFETPLVLLSAVDPIQSTNVSDRRCLC